MLILVLIISVIFRVLASIPVRNMDLTIPDIDALPLSYDSRYAFEEMEDTFKLGDTSTLYIMATREDGWENTAGLGEIKDVEKEIQKSTRDDDTRAHPGGSGLA